MESNVTVEAKERYDVPVTGEQLAMLARELNGGSQINRHTLRKIFGPRYIEALEGMERQGLIQQGIDTVNPDVHIVKLLKPSLDCLRERREQEIRRRQAKESAEIAQAKQDVITLLRALEVTRASAEKTYIATGERLDSVLGLSAESRFERLESLRERKYLNYVGDDSQYELTFLAKSLELLSAEIKRPKKRLDPRNRKGALIRYGEIEGLAVVARCWLKNLNDSQTRKANASETMLQDLIGHRYKELREAYPDLLHEIEAALAAPNIVRV